MRQRLAAVVLALSAAACGGAGNPAAPSNPGGSGSSSGAATSLFDPSVVHDVRVMMAAGDWEALKENYRDNQYYAANVTIDGELAEQVAVRSRGEGSRDPVKPSLKLDFNRYVKGQRFQGQKSVAVKNLTQDASMLRDYLEMSVFEGMGIAAPAYSFARVSVNGEPMGLFNIAEAIEEPFVLARFGEKGGHILNYEYGLDGEAVTWDFTDRGEDPGDYIPRPFEIENDEDTFDAVPLVDFVLTANYEPDESVLAGVAPYIDVDRLLTYVATENALAEHDGFVGDSGMNNFYFYQRAGTPRFLIVPWDKNAGLHDSNWPVGYNLDRNVLVRRLVADPAKMKVYRDALRRAATSFVNARFLGQKLDQAYTRIREAALADTKKPYDNATFEDAVRGLRALIAAREADILSQLP
jgi:spore coat protein CotH